MKKFVFASAMALASMSLVNAPALRAQDSSQITIQDPAEFNAYQNFTTQTDPAQQCAAGESFLQAYPQSVVKKAVLEQMLDCYQKPVQPDKVVSVANRLLQIDPNDVKAIFSAVYVKKGQCAKSVDQNSMVSTDPQTCDDAATMAQKGLGMTKPTSMDDSSWKTLTENFHSAIGLDDMVAKKVQAPGGASTQLACCDYADAIKEYTAELMLYSADECSRTGPCLIDTLQLAQAYSKPGPARDEVKACWFYARAWDFAPAGFKPQIEAQLDYRYKHYHGTLDGEAAITQQIGAIKTQAQSTLFPPASFKIEPAPTPDKLAHQAYTSGDPSKLNLEDKEYILANGTAEDASGLWAILKGQQTPVPGIVIADPATALKISVAATATARAKDYLVKLTNPVACSAVPAPPSDLRVKDAQEYILANGVKADTDAMGDVLTESAAHIHKIIIEPVITEVDVAVTQDAKDNHKADFMVNLKEPASCKGAPEVSSALGLQSQGQAELDGTYDTYTKTAGTSNAPASAQIVLSGGSIQAEPKKGAPARRPAAKPSPAHHAAGM